MKDYIKEKIQSKNDNLQEVLKEIKMLQMQSILESDNKIDLPLIDQIIVDSEEIKLLQCMSLLPKKNKEFLNRFADAMLNSKDETVNNILNLMESQFNILSSSRVDILSDLNEGDS